MSGLAITALTLSQFRSHTATRLQFDGRPVAIYGPNGAGKTNILEAISVLSPGKGLRRAATVELARLPVSIGWKVRAEVRGLGGSSHSVETWAEGEAAREVRIDGKATSQMALGRILRILWLVPAMDRLWIEAPEGRRRFLDRLTLSFVPDHGNVTLVYEKAMRDRNRLLKEGASDPHWFAALEAQMGETGAQIVANRKAALDRLVQAQQSADTAFPQADLRLVGPEGADETEDLGAALVQGRRRDMAAGRTLTGPHRTDLQATYRAKSLPADQCSTGEQKALLISLVLANARALAADLGQPPILLFDEVAAHLDSARRAALFDEICGLGAQAIMTGTEPGLFDAMGQRAQNLMVTVEGGESRVDQNGH